MNRTVVRFVTVLAFGLLVTACGDGGQDQPAPTEPPELACSAEGMDTSVFTENPDLTGPANEIRRAIADAAVRCAYDELAGLGAEDFTYSFGDDGDAAAHWEQEEAAGQPTMRRLVTLLTMDTHVDEATDGEDPLSATTYIWPRAHIEPTEEARAEVERAFGDEAAAWFAPEGYIGPRTTIGGDGAWLYYVIGD